MASKLAKVGVGNIPGANALWVIDPTLTYGGQGATKENSWPTSGHFPEELAMPRWSYSQQDAEFKDAKVEVSNQHGRVMDIVVYPQKQGYGDNTISWDLAGLDRTGRTAGRHLCCQHQQHRCPDRGRVLVRVHLHKPKRHLQDNVCRCGSPIRSGDSPRHQLAYCRPLAQGNVSQSSSGWSASYCQPLPRTAVLACLGLQGNRSSSVALVRLRHGTSRNH